MEKGASVFSRIWTLYQKVHWALFNFGARRLVGPGFVVVGLYGGIYNLPALFPGGTTLVDGVSSDDLFFRLISVFFPLLVAFLGLALCRAKPYHPHHLDHETDT